MPICENCKGCGAIYSWMKMEMITCPNCKGTGKTEQTNEEWLRSASTLDELAERVFNCAMANSWAMNEQQFKMAILSWLKEVHKE